MMGTTPLSTIRKELRNRFARAWFDREIRELEADPEASKGQIESLRLLRDAVTEPFETRPMERDPETGMTVLEELTRLCEELRAECKKNPARSAKKKKRTPARTRT